ncbi:MAG: Hsp20/alpha crystallin family protein [bacterium]|nr:Hsp20/alpha crystallin family protein [bacterium]
MSAHQTSEIQAREKAEVLTEDTRPGLLFKPDVDILEHPDAFVILADLPGASEESVDIHLEKGVLTLDARVSESNDDVQPRYAEYREGGYHRVFRISDEIDADGVSAKMRDGVLELRLPKSAESRPRRIDVAAA